MSKPKLNRLPVIWLMTVVTGQGTLPNPSKMLQVRYLHLSPSLHLNTSWIGSKSFPFLIGCLREFSPKRLQLKFSKYLPDLSSNDAPLTSVRAHTKIYHQNWSPCFSTESISSTISMVCLLYLQFIHMLQHCHTRPKLHTLQRRPRVCMCGCLVPRESDSHGNRGYPSALRSMFDSYLIAVLTVKL